MPALYLHRHCCLWILNKFCFFPEEGRVRRSKQNNSEDSSTQSWGTVNQSLLTVAKGWLICTSCPGLGASALTGCRGRCLAPLSKCNQTSGPGDCPRPDGGAPPHHPQQHLCYLVRYTRLTFISFGLFCCPVQWWEHRELSPGTSPKGE